VCRNRRKRIFLNLNFTILIIKTRGGLRQGELKAGMFSGGLAGPICPGPGICLKGVPDTTGPIKFTQNYLVFLFVKKLLGSPFVNSSKLNPTFRAPTVKPQSGLFVYGVGLKKAEGAPLLESAPGARLGFDPGSGLSVKLYEEEEKEEE
jgi:hypothetical protein